MSLLVETPNKVIDIYCCRLRFYPSAFKGSQRVDPWITVTGGEISVMQTVHSIHPMVVSCGKRSLKWTSGARKSSDTNPGHRTYRVPVQSVHVQGTIADHRERLRMVGSFRGINDGLKRQHKFHPGTHAIDVVRSPVFGCHERLWSYGAKQFTNIRLVPVSNLELIASFSRAELAGCFLFVCFLVTGIDH